MAQRRVAPPSPYKLSGVVHRLSSTAPLLKGHSSHLLALEVGKAVVDHEGLSARELRGALLGGRGVEGRIALDLELRVGEVGLGDAA